MSKQEAPQNAAGLAGVVIADSSLCFIDGQVGELSYRGYHIDELCGRASFEEVAHLLWNGELPTRAELSALTDILASERGVPDAVVDTLRRLPADTAPMEALRSAVSLLASFDADSGDDSLDARKRTAIRLTAKMPTLLAAWIRCSAGKDPVPPPAGGSHAGALLEMMTGTPPSPEAESSLDAALVLHAEHGFNASTFTARVTASTLADVTSTVVAAMAALKGPLHGGANRAVMEMLEEIGTLERVEADVLARLERREKIMGFGHRVYKTSDPRALQLEKMARRLGEAAGDTRWYEMSQRMAEVVMREKKLNPNVDFYSAAAYRSLGIPAPCYPAIFACSRVTGWTAHVLEQIADNKLIRPRSRYVGPRGKRFRPIDERG